MWQNIIANRKKKKNLETIQKAQSADGRSKLVRLSVARRQTRTTTNAGRTVEAELNCIAYQC